ncbi:MAG TPA: succinyl-diaminopimelate desuccinylase [Alphaproteobacteria bacterium]|nr:succinyl-diaminopimelate desuccinylase [Rhodospirillaceae bacterium]HRJ11616.1 succinyl-diaminopimelate desuccinylase [Alphaproteobacteria bacterium]
MTQTYNVLPIAQALLRVPSITPHDNGAMDVLIAALTPLGFECEKLFFTGNDGPDTWNLWATRKGKEPGPHFCFAGHTDVVPAGDVAAWKHDPFGAEIEDGILYGRGAVDMKGGIAAFIAAMEQFPEHPGTLSLLITGNEEGVPNNGTPRVLTWLKEKDIKITHCLVGEPTSESRIGDTIKNGRRGSFSGELIVHGVQGHVAHPHRALNANHLMAQILARLTGQPIDGGNHDFPASTLQVTDMKTLGETATNVVPAIARAEFNIRYNTLQTPDTLAFWLKREIDAVIKPVTGASYELKTRNSASAFLTPPGAYVQLVSEAVMQETGMVVTLATNGGTSDARFIKDHCPVIELGLKNSLAHHVDEAVPVDDLNRLCAIYHRILKRYFMEIRS